MKRVVLDISFAILLTVIAGYTAELSTLGEGLRRQYLGLKSIAGSFTERIVMKEDDREPLFFEGRFSAILPHRFRLEVIRPVRQIIVGNDSVLWFYFPDEKRAILQTQGQSFPFLAFLEPLLDTTAKIIEEPPEDGKPVISIQPNEDAFFAEMKLTLDKTKKRIDGFSFLDNSGNRYQFILKNQRFNPPLSPKEFRFVPPPGTSIEYQ